MSQPSTPSLSYADAGVNIDAGNQLVERIKPMVARTTRPEVIGGIGGFGGLFALPTGFKEPVLVSGTDGVGTKLKLAQQWGCHNTIGIDLVAMCVNDILVVGAEPLYFLDYYATGELSVDTASEVVAGIAAGCQLAGCALIGGETAEMPSMYQKGDYDLAGFGVGIVEKSQIIDGRACQAGDALIALGSSGAHSNGYSLIRKILEHQQTDLNATLPSGAILGEALLAPTKIYVKTILALLKQQPIHAMAHITGGGLIENLPRVLPAHLDAYIKLDNAALPELFSWLQQQGNIKAREMYRTFNCGIGMVLIVPQDAASQVITSAQQMGEHAWQLGNLKAGSGKLHLDNA